MGKKEERECLLMEKFCEALNMDGEQLYSFECGEEGSSDGRLITVNETIPVQITTAEGKSSQVAARAQKSGDVIAYEIRPISWIKGALVKKVSKHYSDERELIILIEYDLSTLNTSFLVDKLRKDEEVLKLVERFKGVYVLGSLNDVSAGKKPFMVKL